MSDTHVGPPKAAVVDQLRSSDAADTLATDSRESALSSVRWDVVETRGANALAPVIDIDRLYEATPGTQSQVVGALDLLGQAANSLADAQRSSDPFEADRFVQRAQLALSKLFAYRSIGEGFAVTINSLNFAFATLHGMPLTSDQLGAVWRVVRELRARPAISLEQGIEFVEDLEERGFSVDPPQLSDLLEAHESAENE